MFTIVNFDAETSKKAELVFLTDVHVSFCSYEMLSDNAHVLDKVNIPATS